METTSNRMSADEFFTRLHEDRLGFPQHTSIRGMVKKSAGTERTIEFAPAGNCDHWVSVPLDYIEDVEFLSQMRCKDHSHPFVVLQLKPATSVEGKLLQALLAASSATPQPGRTMPLPGPGMPYPGRSVSTRGAGSPVWRTNVAYPDTRVICRTVCGPAICPNPTGPGTIWCTDCWIECGPDPTDLPVAGTFFNAW